MELRRRKLDAVTSGAAISATVKVRAHERRLRPDLPPRPNGRGCVTLGGKPVLFEAGRMPEPGGLAVVVTMERTLAVVPVPDQSPQPYALLGKGLVFVGRPGPHPHGIQEIRDPVALVGAVVGRPARALSPGAGLREGPRRSRITSEARRSVA